MKSTNPLRSLQIVTRSKDSRRRFQRLAEAYYEETFARFPTYASHLGRKEFHPLLDDVRAASFAAQLRLTERTLASIEDLPERHFAANDWLDRRALLSELRREQMNLRKLQTWRTNPERYASDAVESIHHLVIRHADDLRPVRAAIESRLKKLPAYLDQAAATVHRPVPLWTQLARRTCEGAPSFFDSLLPMLSPKHGATHHWAKLVSDTKRAFARYADVVSAKPPGPRNGYCIGTQRFEFLIRERLGLDLTAREAEGIARSFIADLNAELAREARKFSTRKSVHEILADAANQWRPREKDLRSEYQSVTTAVKDRFRAANAMTFPDGDTLLVKPVPEFLRHQFPTAAYNSPGPYEQKQIGIFWVNDLSLTKKTVADKRKEIAQHFGLELTAAHEAYPGHHLQFVTQNRHPSRWRRLFAHAIYYEGWTLWVEQMMVDLRITRNPYTRLAQLHDALWRAHRILVDCGLHTGAMDYAAACRHLQRHVGFTAARAQGDVNWYTAAPTVPMSYLLGKHELLRLKRARVDEGGWSLKKFNDWVLSFGAIPWTWIEASGL